MKDRHDPEYTVTMETDQDIEKLEFVPFDNLAAAAKEVRDWLIKYVMPDASRADRQRDEIMSYDGGYVNILIGGDFLHPRDPGATFNAEASLNVQPSNRLARFKLDVAEDPEGTWWYRNHMSCTVGWPSYGSDKNIAGIAMIRANVIMTAARLAEDFERRFGTVIVWQRGQTVQERLARDEAIAAQRLLDSRVKNARDAIRQAIHSTHKRMRVGSDGVIGTSFGAEACRFTIELEKKTYDVVVYQPQGQSDAISATFTRTK